MIKRNKTFVYLRNNRLFIVVPPIILRVLGSIFTFTLLFRLYKSYYYPFSNKIILMLFFLIVCFIVEPQITKLKNMTRSYISFSQKWIWNNCYFSEYLIELLIFGSAHYFFIVTKIFSMIVSTGNKLFVLFVIIIFIFILM